MNHTEIGHTPRRHMKTIATTSRLAPALLTGALLAGGISGCRGDREDEPPRQFFPDMDDQPKFKPQSETDFFSDHRTMRPVVPGAVAFGRESALAEGAWSDAVAREREDLLKEDPVFFTGSNDGGKTWVEKIPVPVTPDMLRRGQDRFNIYCVACHGYFGDGKGAVGVSFNPAVANLLDPKYSDPSDIFGRDGYIFHTILNGKLEGNGSGNHTMPPYAHALSERDAWSIVSYVRALQQARAGSIDDVPAAQRDALDRARPPQMTAPAPAPAPAGEKPADTPGAAK